MEQTYNCHYCEIKPIEMKRRPLCKECYQFLHKENSLDQYPLIPRTSAFKSALVKKYGPGIIDDFDNVLSCEIKGLIEIAKKYGFTREYARQVFEKIYGFHYTVIKNKKLSHKKKQQYIMRLKKKNPTYKVEHYKDGLCKRGAIAEKRVLDICSALGYIVSPYAEDNSIDMIINNYLVEVKSAWRRCYVGGKNTTELYRFQILDSQRKADFIICHIEPINKFFIIPKNIYPKGRYIYITEQKSNKWLFGNTEHISENKYWQFLERWDLLKKQEEINILFSSQSCEK